MDKYFNPEETYNNAIRKKEIGVLRALLTGIIGSDPTFVTTEFEEAVNYIKNKSIDYNRGELILTEEYKKQEDEYEKEAGEWDEQYFQMNLVWLRDNFCLSKRLPLIKEIGKTVYKNKETFGKSKAACRQQISTESGEVDRTVRSDSKKGQAVRTAGGSSYEKDQLPGSFLGKVKDNWWIILIILLLIYLVVFQAKPSGKNGFETNNVTLIDQRDRGMING